VCPFWQVRRALAEAKGKVASAADAATQRAAAERAEKQALLDQV
jgi:hypothetical protein